MSDNFQMPNVITQIRVGKFTLYAYRTLNKAESQLALGMWLSKVNRKKVPKSGSGKVITHFGSDPLSGI